MKNKSKTRPVTMHAERPELVRVRFEFTHPEALAVSVAGTFNGWHPATHSLHSAGNGRWINEATLPPGDYEYCLIVDGRWMPDPLAGETVPNPYGGLNSVLKVTSPSTTAHLEQAAKSSLIPQRL